MKHFELDELAELTSVMSREWRKGMEERKPRGVWPTLLPKRMEQHL